MSEGAQTENTADDDDVTFEQRLFDDFIGHD
jgi:hypothetical protein